MAASKPHILYSFRRCPYAMRARMALYAARIPLELREVVLRDKPEAMLKISPKGTVPVLHTIDGDVIDESLEIMLWALHQNDPEGWLSSETEATSFLIERNDNSFKKALDRYKYPDRYPNEDCSWAKDAGFETLKDLNNQLEKNGYLVRSNPTLADYAIFPFVRQFAHSDMEAFLNEPNNKLHAWLEEFKNCDIFRAVMRKHKPWTPGDPETILMLPQV